MTHTQFSTLAQAESFLMAQGFRLIPDSYLWTNVAGDDADVVMHTTEDDALAFYVEINRCVAADNVIPFPRRR